MKYRSMTLLSFVASSKTPTGVRRLSSVILFPLSPCGVPIYRIMASRLPLLGLSKDHPSADISPMRPVPACYLSKEIAAFGPTLPSVRHLPSLPFLSASTVYAACCLAGLLHPAASHGVRVVSGWASHRPCCHDHWSSPPFPNSRFIPSKAFPFLTAVLRHRSRCLLVVDPSPVSRFLLSTSRPFSVVKSVASNRVAAFFCSLLPWALFPFKVLPSTAVSVFGHPAEYSCRSRCDPGCSRRSVYIPTTIPPKRSCRPSRLPKLPRRQAVRTGLSWAFTIRLTDPEGIL